MQASSISAAAECLTFRRVPRRQQTECKEHALHCVNHNLSSANIMQGSLSDRMCRQRTLMQMHCTVP